MKIFTFRNIIKYLHFLFIPCIFLYSCGARDADSQNDSSVYSSPKLIEQGEQLYLSLGCAQCHTKDG